MVGEKIPEFTLQNTRGDRININKFYGKKNVVLILLRGLMCPFCRAHLARLAKNLEKFEQLDTEIYAITADRYENARRLELAYAKEKFPIYFDPTRDIVKLLHQEIKFLKLGRLPALLIIDKRGTTRYAYYGEAMLDIPTIRTVFNILKQIQNQ